MYKRKFISKAIVFVSVLVGLLHSANGAPVNVTQHHNHYTRDGLYIDPAFTYSAASNLTRNVSFNGAIDGNVYAQPLYIEGGPGGGAVVIAVTESNYVYALDAVSGNICVPTFITEVASTPAGVAWRPAEWVRADHKGVCADASGKVWKACGAPGAGPYRLVVPKPPLLLLIKPKVQSAP